MLVILLVAQWYTHPSGVTSKQDNCMPFPRTPPTPTPRHHAPFFKVRLLKSLDIKCLILSYLYDAAVWAQRAVFQSSFSHSLNILTFITCHPFLRSCELLDCIIFLLPTLNCASKEDKIHYKYVCVKILSQFRFYYP